MPRRLGALGASAALAAGFTWGFAAHRQQVFPYGVLTALYRRSRPEVLPQHWWPRRGAAAIEGGVDTSRVLTLPYAEGYVAARAARGVLRHEPAAAAAGLNFYYSGHAPEAFLVDMHGRVLHRWGARFEQVWPGRVVPRGSRGSEQRWAFARLLPDGGVLGVVNGLGLVRLDRGSRVAWARAGGYHHTVEPLPDGTLLALSRRKVRLPSLNPRAMVLEDLVEVLDPEGNVRRQVSLVECFQRSRYASLLQFVDRQSEDPFHTNALTWLDGSWESRHPAFRRGRVLLSLPRLNTLAVVDIEERRVVWALAGLFASQHDPTPLANGRFLVFDNWGRGGRSRVVEIDPFSHGVAWEFPEDADADFFSLCCGAAQRLSNGNTLITESTAGRAIEVTPKGRIVWEFVNPARAGADADLVATLFRMERLEHARAAHWPSGAAPRDAP